MLRLENKVALVTGGTGGLGSEIAREFAREGAAVAVIDRAAGDEIVAELVQLGASALALTVDITREPEVEAAVAEIERTLGPINILINVAGIAGSASPTHEATESEFDAVFAVNVKGTFFCTKHVIRGMLEGGRGGSIVNISSTYGVAANADIPLYHATKAAVIMMAKTDGVTYATRGIRSNAIVLGSTKTPMAEAAGAVSPEGAAYLQNLIDLHPVKRQAEAIEIARVVAFLASDDASYITAAAVPVDGGYTAV